VLDNDYLINRYDDCVVDGRHWEKKVHLALQENNHISYAIGMAFFHFIIHTPP
jgi:hypothetical protein